MKKTTMERHQPIAPKAGFTLAEVLIAVSIFVIAIFAILMMVSQSMELVRSMQRQQPDLGTLAGKTMLGLLPPDGDLESGETKPFDEDFGGNEGGSIALYPDATWTRYLEPIDETNGLYRATITVIEINKDGQETESTLDFLLFRSDLAEAEVGAGTQ
jgi:type II secretory pathway pseudopilin PulG|tara:strand:+ start:348 stop:821 length:474 start_codon:yes stop_codon:yes gene_type:complete